jgi:tetratricopeptide (TPR) repeat protein
MMPAVSTDRPDLNPGRSLDMKKSLVALVFFGLLAGSAVAQSKLDQAIEKAQEQLQKGKPEDAIKTLSKAADQFGAEGQVALGQLQERIGNLEEAKNAFAQARSSATGPSRSSVLAAVANFTLRTGTGKDALAIAREAVAAGATPEALAAEARAQVRSDDGPGALVTADKAVAAGPTSAIAHVARAEALLALGRNADGEAEARRATELDPKSALAWSRLARLLLAVGRPADAVAAARKATELDDKFGEGFAILGVAILAQSPKDWSDAIAQAQQGHFLDPGNPIVETAVGKIFEANGQYEQAAASYRRALATDSGFAPARLALIQAELNRGNREAALAEAKKVATEMPTSPELQLLIGEMTLRNGDYAEALGYLEKAMKGLPGNGDGWALLGRAYHYARRYDDAADAYGRAVELQPQNLSLRATYGLVLGQAGDLEKGLAELKKVTSTPGYKDAAGWVNLGWIYRNMNQPRESIAAYQKGLELDPKQEQAALGLGWAYQYTKEYDKAIAAYEQAMRIDPKEAAPDANLGIAWCYFFKRDVPQAKAYMEKAASAGRSVVQLKDNIDKLEKYIAEGRAMTEAQMAAAQAEQQAYEERAKKVEVANNAVRSRNPQTRIRAARDLASLAGGEAVPTLIYLMQTDTDYDVRITAANLLGNLGSAARSAIPNIQGLLRQPPYEAPINASQQEMDNMMKDGDYRRALRDALQKIQK